MLEQETGKAGVPISFKLCGLLHQRVNDYQYISQA